MGEKKGAGRTSEVSRCLDRHRTASCAGREGSGRWKEGRRRRKKKIASIEERGNRKKNNRGHRVPSPDPCSNQHPSLHGVRVVMRAGREKKNGRKKNKKRMKDGRRTGKMRGQAQCMPFPALHHACRASEVRSDRAHLDAICMAVFAPLAASQSSRRCEVCNFTPGRKACMQWQHCQSTVAPRPPPHQISELNRRP